MTRKLFYIIALTCVSLASCNTFWIPSNIKRNFTNCYDGENTGLDSIININGYYRVLSESDRWGENAVYVHKVDTFYTCFMFFSDGLYLGLFNTREIDLTDFFNEVITCIDEKSNKCSFYKHYYWGRYYLKSDTIVVQSLNHARSLNDYYYGSECKYKIIDKNTLLFSSSKPLHRTNPLPAIELERKEQKEVEFEKVFGRKRADSDTAKFVPLEEIPPSDCWLKKKRWFWCDKEKYKKWKKGEME